MHDQEEVVTNATEVDMHVSVLLQQKVEELIASHVQDYAGIPLFLQYAMMNVHGNVFLYRVVLFHASHKC